MAKKKRTRDSITEPPVPEKGKLDREELISLVLMYHCQGYGAREIRDLMQQKHGVKLTREQPFRFVSYAAKQGRLYYQAPIEMRLTDRVMRRHPWLQRVRVVKTASPEDVARAAAEVLRELAQAHFNQRPEAKEFHIGFAGGNHLRRTARIFADMLREPWELPKTIVFHSMVAGFNVENPLMDPNSFLSFFGPDQGLQVKTEFVGLPTIGIVRQEDVEKVRELAAVRYSLERADNIDVIATSAGHWQNGDSVLHSMYAKESLPSLDQLKEADCVGDMMWRPVNRAGPIELETAIRAMTLMELPQLPGFIAQGKRVILLTGPCGRCGGPKTDVLEPILGFGNRVITDLVADSRTAGGLFRGSWTA